MLGIVAALFGTWWILEVFVAPVVKNLMDPKNPGGFIFIFTVSPLMAFPGAALVVFGIGLVRSKVLGNFRSVVAWLAFFGVMTAEIYLPKGAPFSADETVWEALKLLIVTLVFIWLYVVLVNKLMDWDGCPTPGYRAVFGKGIIWIVDLELLNLGQAVSDFFLQSKTNYAGDDAALSFTGFAITVAVVVIFHHSAVRILGLRKPGQTPISDSPSESSPAET